MPAEYDKFKGGSHAAKNAAGISRKDIINRTHDNMVSKFKYIAGKAALEVTIKQKAGKVLGTRPIDVNGRKVQLPVYESSSMHAAEFATAFIAGFSGDMSSVEEGLAVCEVLKQKVYLARLTASEFQAWGAYQLRLTGMKRAGCSAAIDEDYVEPVQTIEVAEESHREQEDDVKAFTEYFKEKVQEVALTAGSEEEARKAKLELRDNMEVMWNEFVRERNENRKYADEEMAKLMADLEREGSSE